MNNIVFPNINHRVKQNNLQKRPAYDIFEKLIFFRHNHGGYLT